MIYDPISISIICWRTRKMTLLYHMVYEEKSLVTGLYPEIVSLKKSSNSRPLRFRG
jgi:hypothetical protein